MKANKMGHRTEMRCKIDDEELIMVKHNEVVVATCNF